MALTVEDLSKIKDLLSPIEVRLGGLETRMGGFERRIDEFEKRVELRFDTMDQYFDALFARDEINQQESLVTREQLGRLEKRVSILERKVR